MDKKLPWIIAPRFSRVAGHKQRVWTREDPVTGTLEPIMYVLLPNELNPWEGLLYDDVDRLVLTV